LKSFEEESFSGQKGRIAGENMDWKIPKAKCGLKGELEVPPDKSISHRAVILGSIASGVSTVKNFLSGEDCLRTIKAFRDMGVQIESVGKDIVVHGKGLKGLKRPSQPLYAGNSGTTMRILTGVAAGQNFDTRIEGDKSLTARPMGRIIEPLTQMGAEIRSAGGEDHAPLEIKGGKKLVGINYVMPVASAQVKSCVLIAGLFASGKTTVQEPFQSRDHTERMMEFLGADMKRKGLTSEISGSRELVSKDIKIPADVSSAAFFIVAALLIKDSRIVLRNVGLNPTRMGLINVLKKMGAKIRIFNYKNEVEPSGNLEIVHSELKAVVVEKEEIPLLIDEVPILALAALGAEGETIIRGISELKVKETDRVKTVRENFRRLGAEIKESGEDLVISGNLKKLHGAEFDSFGDHRIAMTLAVAGLLAAGESKIKDTKCVETSYPGFLEDLGKLSGI